MLEGIEGLKLLKESSYYSFTGTGVIILIIGITLLIASLFLIGSEYEKVWNIICVIVAIIGLSLIINILLLDTIIEIISFMTKNTITNTK